MTKEEFIKGVREYLDEPQTSYLFTLAKETEDVETLRNLVKRAKSLHTSYVHDADYWLYNIDCKSVN